MSGYGFLTSYNVSEYVHEFNPRNTVYKRSESIRLKGTVTHITAWRADGTRIGTYPADISTRKRLRRRQLGKWRRHFRSMNNGQETTYHLTRVIYRRAQKKK